MAELSTLTDDQIKALLGASGGAPASSPATSPQPAPQTLQTTGDALGNNIFNSLTTGAEQGATGNYGDEAEAAIAAPFRAGYNAYTGADAGKPVSQRLSDAYNTEIAHQDQHLQEAHDAHPWAYNTGELIGSAAFGGPALKAGATLLKAGKVIPTVLRGIGEGGVYGAIFGSGEGRGIDQKIEEGAKGAATGAVVGGALGAAAGAGSQPIAPTIENLEKAKQTAYGLARANRYVAKADDVYKFAQGLQRSAIKEGVNIGQHPQTWGAVKSFVRNATGNKPLDVLDLDRQNFVNILLSPKADDQDKMKAYSILQKFDNFFDKYPSGPLWKDARTANTVFENSKVLDKAFADAKLVSQKKGGHLDDALQNEFQKIVKTQYIFKKFQPDEQDIIRKVAESGLTRQVLQQIGRVSLTSGGISALSHLGLLITGHFTGTLPVMIPGMAAAEIARQTSRALRVRDARAAQSFVQSRNLGAAKFPIMSRPGQALFGGLTHGLANVQPQLSPLPPPYTPINGPVN